MPSVRKLVAIPNKILAACVMLDPEMFPFNVNYTYDAESTRILARILETGYNSKELRDELLSIVDGDKDKELYSFVNIISYLKWLL